MTSHGPLSHSESFVSVGGVQIHIGGQRRNLSLRCGAYTVIGIAILVPRDLILSHLVPVVPHGLDYYGIPDLVQIQGVQAGNFVKMPIDHISKKLLYDTIGRRISYPGSQFEELAYIFMRISVSRTSRSQFTVQLRIVGQSDVETLGRPVS